MSYDQGYRTGLGRVVCAREDQLGPKAASYRKGSRTWDKIHIAATIYKRAEKWNIYTNPTKTVV